MQKFSKNVYNILANGSTFVNRDTYNPFADPSGCTTGMGVFFVEIEMKKCTKCGVEKPATTEFFQKGKKEKDGGLNLKNQCKACKAEYDAERNVRPKIKARRVKNGKAWREANKNHLSEYKKAWREANPDYVPPSRVANPNYVPPCVATNPDYHANYQRERYRNDPNFKLTSNMRSRFYIWFTKKGANKQCSVFELTGCTLSELWDHLESQFENGMTRDNYGEWHVDHIIPLSAFNPNCWMQMSIAWDLDNLQPLWAEDNLRKGSKII